MLSRTTDKYKLAGKARDYFFPDSIVDAFMKAHTPLPAIPAANQQLSFTPAQSRQMIVAALSNFHPELGQKAEEIFAAGFDTAIQDNFIEEFDFENSVDITADTSRWRIRQIEKVEPVGFQLMRCVPAKAQRSELLPNNPHDHAVIQMEFDGSLNSMVYLAHELGHAIADDYQREKGNSYKSNPKHLTETHACLVQNILYAYLQDHEDPEIRAASYQHFRQTMSENLSELPDPQRTHDRPMSILTAASLVNELSSHAPEIRRNTGEMLLGRHGPTGLTDIFEAANIQTQEDIDNLAQLTVRNIQSGISLTGAAQPAVSRELN